MVILNWNGKRYLEKFLPSVIKYSANADIIVADNGSTDDSVGFLENNFPLVKCLELGKNTGFAQGYNNALARIYTGEKHPQDLYYIMLNSDVEVTENWITPVIELMEQDPAIAAAQPKIRSFYEKKKFEYAGAAGGFIDKFGYPFCRGRIFDNLETDHGQYDDNCEIFWATGACLFVKAEKFHEAGGFDADFFAHMEEIDLCWRLKNSGHKVMYCPYSTVFHVGGGTLHKSNPKKTYLNFRNNLWLLLKNLPSHKLFFILFMRLSLDGLAGLKFFAAGNVKDCLAIIKAHISAYLTLFGTLKKRKKIPSVALTGIYKGSIVADYYLRGKKRFSELVWKG